MPCTWPTKPAIPQIWPHPRTTASRRTAQPTPPRSVGRNSCRRDKRAPWRARSRRPLHLAPDQRRCTRRTARSPHAGKPSARPALHSPRRSIPRARRSRRPRPSRSRRSRPGESAPGTAGRCRESSSTLRCAPGSRRPTRLCWRRRERVLARRCRFRHASRTESISRSKGTPLFRVHNQSLSARRIFSFSRVQFAKVPRNVLSVFGDGSSEFLCFKPQWVLPFGWAVELRGGSDGILHRARTSAEKTVQSVADELRWPSRQTVAMQPIVPEIWAQLALAGQACRPTAGLSTHDRTACARSALMAQQFAARSRSASASACLR